MGREESGYPQCGGDEKEGDTGCNQERVAEDASDNSFPPSARSSFMGLRIGHTRAVSKGDGWTGWMTVSIQGRS
ncbi:hypothetical protein [Salinithrix halophila]|uniref:Uncharacterized protein n=1 Tax=Salinithrix halophila TaxID=1485204 RepID=A0ABV8JI71_9BACL